MKATQWIGLAALAGLSALLAGCSGKEKGSEAKEYDLKGRVTAVASDKSSVTLDHEDIPGLMKAMKGMKFKVEDAKVLEGIAAGDDIRGRLKVKAGEQVIIHLEKAKGSGEQGKREKVTANLAKLGEEDRKLAEAQKYCVVEADNLLGSMGKPFKIVLKDQPVFLCCKSCAEEARADPDKTLARVKELRSKNAEPGK